MSQDTIITYTCDECGVTGDSGYWHITSTPNPRPILAYRTAYDAHYCSRLCLTRALGVPLPATSTATINAGAHWTRLETKTGATWPTVPLQYGTAEGPPWKAAVAAAQDAAPLCATTNPAPQSTTHAPNPCFCCRKNLPWPFGPMFPHFCGACHNAGCISGGSCRAATTNLAPPFDLSAHGYLCACCHAAPTAKGIFCAPCRAACAIKAWDGPNGGTYTAPAKCTLTACACDGTTTECGACG